MHRHEELLEVLVYRLPPLQEMHPYFVLLEQLLGPFLYALDKLAQEGRGERFPEVVLPFVLEVLVHVGGHCVYKVALVIVSLADPTMGLLLPILVCDVDHQKGGRAVAEVGLPEVLVKLRVVARAVPELDLHDGALGLQAIYGDLVLFSRNFRLI